MRARILSITVVALVAVAIAVPPAMSGAAPTAWRQKVASQVLRDTAGGESASFVVMLASQADVGMSASLPTKLAKGRFVFDTLRAHANRTQAPIRALLDRSGIQYRTHWVVNVITVVRGNWALVRTLASRSDVARVDVNDWVRSAVLPTTPAVPAQKWTAPDTIGWNVRKVKAPIVWGHGFTGQGIVVGDIDVGFQWDHPALKLHYRGWNGSVADHNYNWYDEIDPRNRAPIDPNGHGTATVGTIIGDDGGSNQIGVAPGAKWMGCRAMNESGLGTPDTYIGCLEFMVAPFDLDGNNPDPSKAPAAINNSWFCSISQGECPNQSILLTAVQAVRSAGLLPRVAARNSRPSSP